MATVTFDTLKFVETLRDAGMPEAQAKAVSHAVREAHETADLATGRDLREASAAIRADLKTVHTAIQSNMQALRADIQSDMQTLRGEVKSDIQSLRAEVRALEPRLTIRLGGVVVVALGAFTALSKWVA
jgi:uncharacterized protein with von Willebrand factor type A (vWA) domain